MGVVTVCYKNAILVCNCTKLLKIYSEYTLLKCRDIKWVSYAFVYDKHQKIDLIIIIITNQEVAEL